MITTRTYLSQAIAALAAAAVKALAMTGNASAGTPALTAGTGRAVQCITKGNEPGSTFACSLDGAAFTACAGPASQTALAVTCP